MLKSLFFWRSYLSYLLILLLGTSLFAALLLKQLQQDELSFIEFSLRSQTELVALNISRPLRNLDYETIRQSVRVLNELSEARYTVVDVNGVAIADSLDLGLSFDNYLTRPEIQQAIQRGYGQVLRYSQNSEEVLWFSSSPVIFQGQVIGFARIAQSGEDIVGGIREQQTQILKIGSGILFLGLMLAFYFAARESAVIEHVTSVAQGVSKGDFKKRASEKNGLGLKKLAEAINQMARNSAERVSLITVDRNRLAAIFAGLVEGVIDVDQDQNIIHINDAAAKLLNVSAIACTGMPVWQAIHQHEIVGALDQAIKNQSVANTQMTLTFAQKSKSLELVLDVYAASLSDDEGQPIGAVVVLHDISELKSLERVRTDFVANASHELKTPITAIRGLSETILADENAEKRTIISFMDRVHAQSLRLSHLVEDLLTLSRLESSHTEELIERINMTELVERSIKVANMTKNKKGLSLQAKMINKPLFVFGDGQSLSQLVDNLIDNAIKYTAEDGKVEVELKVDLSDLILIVKDNGLGISPQYQKRIFERFYRVDKSRSQSLGGTGLGLSIVKNIAEKHGGQVSLESYLGNGSTFIFKMPLVNAKKVNAKN